MTPEGVVMGMPSDSVTVASVVDGGCDVMIGRVVGRAVDVEVFDISCGRVASCAASNAVIVLVVLGGAKFNGCW